MAELSLAAFTKQIEQEKAEIKKIGEVTITPVAATEPPGTKKGPLAPVPESPTEKSSPKRRAKSAKRQ